MINHLQGEAPQMLRASVQGFSTTVWGAAQLPGHGLGGVLARGPTAALYRWAAVITSIAAVVFLLVPAGRAEAAREELP